MIQIIYATPSGDLTTIEMVDLSRSHDMAATPTDSPVEKGVTISDHLRPELHRLSLKCLITNQPIKADTTNVGVPAPRMGSVDLGTGKSATVLTWDTSFDVVQSVYDQLVYINENSLLTTIVTPTRRFESMALVSIGVPFDNTDGIEVAIEARQMKIVETQTAAAPRPTVIRANSRTNAGHQGTTQVSTAQSADASVLYNLVHR